MVSKNNILIHFSIGHRGKDFYITPCGKTGGDYYVTQNKKEVTCKLCRESYEAQ